MPYRSVSGSLQVSSSKGIKLAIDEMLKAIGETELNMDIRRVLAMGEKVVKGCSISE